MATLSQQIPQDRVLSPQPQAQGGTEILVREFTSRMPSDLLNSVHMSVSTVHGKARHLKPHILWGHQSYDQPSVQNFRDSDVVATIDTFVFVSEWQREQFLTRGFAIPPQKTTVIRNAIVPIPSHIKKPGPIKLLYTSTPFRGLDVLLDAFLLLNHSDIELHIYSGMALYDRPLEDVRFEHLYQRAREMKNVFYHGTVSNETVRTALQEGHVFAYPSTWEETSCLSLIEALSAGCRAVVPALGALEETANGFAQLYHYSADKKEHAKRFAHELEIAIENFWTPEVQKGLARQKSFFDSNYSWDVRVPEWLALLESLAGTV